MTWIYLVVALITFLISKKSGASTGAALGYAALAAGATYGVANYTDWGQQNILPLGQKVDSLVTGTPTTTTSGTASGGGNSSIGGWLPVAAAAVGGAALSSGSTNWFLIAGAVVATYILVK